MKTAIFSLLHPHDKATYSWFATTWQGSHVGGQNRRIFFSKNYNKTVVMSAANQWLNTINSPLYQSIPKLPICNLHISHNTPCLPPKFFIIFVFNFSWLLEWPQEKKKTMLMQNYGGQTRCIVRDMQMTNCCLYANPKHPTFTKISKVSESCLMDVCSFE